MTADVSAPGLGQRQVPSVTVSGTISMQSTGHGSMHSSQPVHSLAMTVCICLAAPRMASTGTGLDTQGAADAQILFDHRQRRQPLFAALRIERLRIPLEQVGEGADGGLAAGRAAIDIGSAVDDRFGVGLAARETALCALGLRQQRVDTLDHRVALAAETDGGEPQQQAEAGSETRDGDDGGQHQPFTRPANPIKPSAIRPAVIKAMAAPWNGAGTSATATRSRTPANMISTRENPSAAPRP